MPSPSEWTKRVAEQFVAALNKGAKESEEPPPKKPARKSLPVVRIKR